ncbi:unnamed protein product (macronuclear) [Paramecium tetraurelia]|uniref:Protein kinase domain-containing protein n=1 Tax=Paramecium tetraurelia TaxID=5888 RepID=A0CIV0_PARTE|nr:uncharacterized protein GSPATT00007852001 [Paramecium tetraurelia]CAK70717.1 unnamed protein product [Paramecium tetraurelia]|eukprot:XP_001438114.1 hypothetical protein (macronuclear) [Paramecium tetraurelia strain d4-2]
MSSKESHRRSNRRSINTYRIVVLQVHRMSLMKDQMEVLLVMTTNIIDIERVNTSRIIKQEDIFPMGLLEEFLKVRRRKFLNPYAMKIVRSNHAESAQQEADILFYLKKKDLNRYFVEIIESFYHRGYYCMVFERLGPSLNDMLRLNQNRGIPMHLIRSISRQLIKSIGHLHEIKLTHTDLKPENILFSRIRQLQKQNDLYLPADHRIKIIDLGGAEFDDEDHNCIINTRQYRAPEVQLQCCRWDQKSDVWGIACIIFEMYTGHLLFQTRKNEFEHMALVEKVTEQSFPHWMASNVKGCLKHCFNVKNATNGKYYIWPQGTTTKESVLKVKKQQSLREMILDPLLRDLLVKMLEIDPHKRISCSQALDHKFFLN